MVGVNYGWRRRAAAYCYGGLFRAGRAWWCFPCRHPRRRRRRRRRCCCRRCCCFKRASVAAPTRKSTRARAHSRGRRPPLSPPPPPPDLHEVGPDARRSGGPGAAVVGLVDVEGRQVEAWRGRGGRDRMGHGGRRAPPPAGAGAQAAVPRSGTPHARLRRARGLGCGNTVHSHLWASRMRRSRARPTPPQPTPLRDEPPGQPSLLSSG